ncbi:4594_t:CDS:2, partial [Racocetra fulgida]
ISLEKQSMHISVLPSTIANNNNKEKFDNEASGSGKAVNKENETTIDDASLNKTSIGHNITMDGVQKERTIPFIEPTLSVNEKASIEHQFSTPMDVDTFYLDVGIRDISDVERVGILLRKDRSDSFRILNPQTLANCVGLDLSDKDLLAFHSSPDETILSSTFRTFSEIEFKKAWDDFVDRIQNVDSLISALLNPNIEGIVATNAFELERIVNLLAEVFHQISDVIIEVLRGLLECMEETRVVEILLGCCDKNRGYDTLYKTYILPMLQVKRLSSRTLHLLQAIVKKVSVYEACTLIQQMADNELRHESIRRKSYIEKNEVTSDSTQHDVNSMLVDENPQEQEQDDVELIIEQVIDCLQIISKAALYHLALNASDEINQDYPTTFSFRYLTSCRLFSAITVLLSSQRIRACSRFHELVNSLGKLCIILLGAPVGMLYLARQLQQSRDQVGNSLITIWSSLLCQQNQDLNLQDETDESFANIHPISIESWSDVDEIRRTPGVGDIWCGLGQSTSGNYDEDYDYIYDYSEDETSVNEEENYNVTKARQILKMQSYGAIGSESDCLDKCIIPSDQLAVASTIIYLDALPTILSLVNVAPIQDTAMNSAASDALNAFGRIPLELLELAIKFSQAFPFLLTHQMHELLFSVASSESNLRSLWEPIAVFHETGTIQGVIDIIKHQKYYPECLRDHHVVNQILVALKLLMSYTYTEGGVLQILKARMDDFSGFDNGDTFFVFLLRLLNHSAEILSDMSDFVVYAEHQTTAEPAAAMTNDEQTLNIQEHIKSQDNPKFSGNTTENNKSDPQSTTFTTTSGAVLSSEVFEHRRELLDLVWHNLILIRRLLRVVYGDPKNSASKRHFKNIYGRDELPDDPLPSQKKSMIQICIEPLLMLMSALDHLDGRLNDQLGAVSLLGFDQPFKNGQSVQIFRVRGLLLGMFGLLSQVIIEEKDSASNDVIGEFKCRSRFFSDFAGRHVVKHLINFIFEGPDNFLSGLHILNEILPIPLLKNQKYQQTDSHNHSEVAMHDENLNFIDGYSLSTNFSNVQMEAQIFRNYWIDQLLPLRDDIMQLIRSLAPASSKIIHIMLRAVICQLIDLDVHDRGIGRGVISVIVNEVRKSLIQCRSTLEKIDNQKASLNIDELKEGTEQTDDTVESSSELETKLALFGRWMSLLTSLATNPSGKSLILDFLADTADDTLNGIDKQGSPEISRGLLSLFLDFINTTITANFVYDLIMEFLFSICNCSKISSGAIIPEINDLSSIIDNLLNCVRRGKNGRLQNQSLIILKKIVETEIGTLIILTKQEHRQFISNMITWVPTLLRSPDLRMQDMNIAYNLVVFILKVISYIPHTDDDSVGIEEIGSLSLLIDAHEGLETLNVYDNIEQHVLELSFDSNRIEEDIMFDNHLCQLTVNVIRTLKEHLHAYALKRNDRLINRDEIIKKYDLRMLK